MLRAWIYDFANALGVFIRSNPCALADSNNPFSAVLEQLSASPLPIRPLWIAVISLGILKVTLLQEVVFPDDDAGISIALEEHFVNQRHWLAVTPRIQSPLYASRPNQPPDFQFHKGIALTWWQNHPVMVCRDGAPLGHYWFYCIWPSSQPIRSWFASLQPKLLVVFLYLPAHPGSKVRGWVHHRIPVRRMDTIHCEVKEEIMTRIKKHQNTKSRQNWVFEGPPGVGKTSMAYAVAAKLDQPLFSFPVMNSQMDDSTFRYWLEQIPANAVVFMDDVRYPFPQKLSITSVLDFLDGTMAALHLGRLLIVNTNSPGYVKSLPAPLQRAGRLRETFRFSLATRSEAEAVFMQEYQGSLLGEQELQELARYFGAHVAEKQISQAAIERFLRNFTPHEAVKDGGSMSAHGDLQC